MATVITRKDGKTVSAFVSASNTDKPAVIVIQEWWGINDQMKKRAGKFEAAGFRTILPDLYHGKSADIGKTAEAKHLYDNLDWPEALLDLEACIEFALSSGSPKLVVTNTSHFLLSLHFDVLLVTGYCMGGALALAAATKFSNISAIAPFYGLPDPTMDIGAIKCPVQGHYAEHDDWCGPTQINERLTPKLNVAKEIFVYQGTHHAFTNEARPDVYDAHATETALDRTLVFFGRYLY